jgi:hypothetical protein
MYIFRTGVNLFIVLRAKCILRSFGDKALKTMSGPRTEEATRGRRGLHNFQFHNLYSSLNKLIGYQNREDETGGISNTHESHENCTQRFDRKILKVVLGKYYNIYINIKKYRNWRWKC